MPSSWRSFFLTHKALFSDFSSHSTKEWVMSLSHEAQMFGTDLTVGPAFMLNPTCGIDIKEREMEGKINAFF